jgi:AcrR family transcriptional regulator
VNLPGEERAVQSHALVARVEDAAGAGLDRGLDADAVQGHLVEVAAELLATQGPDAVTTRSVALAAGVQAPTIYRLFGDKNGLLDAVVQHGFASYLARKPPVAGTADPVAGLRAGWELHVDAGIAVADPAAAAVTLRAAADDLAALTPAERALLGDWLDRIAGAGATSLTPGP